MSARSLAGAGPRGRWLPLLLAASLCVGCPAKKQPTTADAAPPTPKSKKKGPPPDLPDHGPLAQRLLYEQAKSLLRAAKPAEAVEAFRRAIAADATGEALANCYLGLGSALGDLGRHAEAVEVYRKVVVLRPSDPEAYRALAIGLEEAGKLDDAKQSLEQSLALNADQLSAYQDLATLYLRAKDVEGAKKVYLRYELRRTVLIKTLGLSKEEQARVAAALALGEARDEATTKALGLALTDRSRGVRLAVIRALGQQGLAGGVGPLKELRDRVTDDEEKRQIETSLRAIAAAAQPTTQPAPGTGTSAGSGARRRPPLPGIGSGTGLYTP
jgi:tetratricopeptide (TPR) repeat protein